MLGLSIGVLTTTGVISATGQSPAAGFHVTICHRTGSASNPYIIISPDVEGVVNGHLDHEQTGNGLGGDIVPEFIYNGIRYSKNLNTDFGNGISGARILASGCRMPGGPTPTPTPRLTPTPTPPGPTPTPPGATPTPPGATPTPPPPNRTPTPPVPVPEPATIILLATGLLGLGGDAVRRRFGKRGREEDV